MNHSLYKVAIVGPESTGKSFLSEKLAQYFNVSFVPEIARSYLDNLTTNYSEKDLLIIAELQCKAEDELIAQSKELLICDTTLLVIKIWSLVKYNRCDEWIIENEINRKYDLFLLTNIDLPWEPDPQREHPNAREMLFNLYHEALIKKNVPFEIISGLGENRTQNAIKAINRQRKKK